MLKNKKNPPSLKLRRASKKNKNIIWLYGYIVLLFHCFIAKLNKKNKNKKTKSILKKISSPLPRRRRSGRGVGGEGKKELILPLYFGWQIKVVLSKIKRAAVLFYNSFALEKVKNLQNHIIGPFKKYWQFMTVVVLLIALVSSSMLLKNYESVEAATYYFVQSDWSGGLDGGVYPDHTDNKTNWNKYSAVDDNMATSTDLSLTATSASWTQTTDADFNLGATFLLCRSENDRNEAKKFFLLFLNHLL